MALVALVKLAASFESDGEVTTGASGLPVEVEADDVTAIESVRPFVVRGAARQVVELPARTIVRLSGGHSVAVTGTVAEAKTALASGG